MRIDRDKFFAAVEESLFKRALAAQQGATLEKMLSYWEDRFQGKPLSWLSYTLATAYHETDKTFGPIREYGGSRKRYAPYYGRGLVQLTWEYNYRKMSEVIGVDLVKSPDAALDVDNAVPIIFEGMRRGMFTGIAYDKYLNGDQPDYVNARRMINGTDKSKLIAGYAEKFAAALVASAIETTPKEMKQVSTGFWVTRTARSIYRTIVPVGTGAAVIAQQARDFLTSWEGMLVIGVLVLAGWAVIEYLDQRKQKDIREGRHIPSTLADT